MMRRSRNPNDGTGCPVCGHVAQLAFTAKYVEARKCSAGECGHIWAFGVSPAHGLQDRAAHSNPERFKARNERLVRSLARRGFLHPSGSLLDVGSGGGHFIGAVRECYPTLRLSCVEPHEESRIDLSRAGFTVFASVEAVPGTFDAISLIEVIEHAADPVRMLGELHARLRPGGRLFFTTPCGEMRNGSRDTAAYDTPEHVQFFTHRSLVLAARMAGFRAVELRRLAELYPLDSALSRAGYRLTRAVLDVLRGRDHLTGFMTP